MRYFFQTLFILLTSTTVTFAQQLNPSDKIYTIQDSLLIKTRDGANISTIVVRKKGVVEKQSTILIFTVYARETDIKKAKEAADKGYVGVLAYTRGKRLSPDVIIPYEHDGEDVYDVIEWITKQSWSNSKVGMYGGSYNGFTQWAAAKHLHPALKTIVPSAAAAPGLDVPMMNNVVMSFPFSWTYYVSNNKFLDTADYNSPKWATLYQKWFEEGKSYRSLDSMTGRLENKIFQRWLDHPTYDKYWQDMIPYKNEFSKINIPILTTTGYYDGGQVGAMNYFREHYKYNHNPNHYLIIGPYGHFGSQGYPDSTYNGYKIDSVANIPIHNIIYQWFDFILKGGTKPAVLKDKINYQVMGSNTWKHTSSLKKMNNDTLKYYFINNILKKQNKSDKHKPQKEYLTQEINFADRTTSNSYYYADNILYDSLNTNGIIFKSDRLSEELEINGCFSGEIKATINKKDMDFSVVLFEELPNGKYFYLSYFMGRASYSRDISKRQLLIPNKKEILPFSNSYFTSKKLGRGSRIVVIININKSPFEQINYGTGKDVNEETIKDANEPLQIKWHNDSYIKIPVWRNKPSDKNASR